MPRGSLEAGAQRRARRQAGRQGRRGRSYAAPRLSPVCSLPQPCTEPRDLARTQVLAAHMPLPDALKNWPERSSDCSLVDFWADLDWLVLVYYERKTLLVGWFRLAETNKRTGCLCWSWSSTGVFGYVTLNV